MKLTAARSMIDAALAHARKKDMSPLAVVVLDARGVLKFAAAEDGTSLRRAEIATGKAHGALAMGLGSRTLHTRVQKQPYFIAAVTHAVGGLMVPVPGGVLIRSTDGELLGAIGISGDNSDNDEEAAMAGIAAVGLVGDPGT
ncbi:MAG: heme-binding protein [Hyphomicrobiaceae bacterium]